VSSPPEPKSAAPSAAPSAFSSAASSATAEAATTHDSTHPAGLYVLFGAEAWERFSYYGMRALLTLYLVNHLDYSRQDALAVYGLYTGLVYLTPLFGGLLADRLLGRRKAVVIGGALMALGHLAMASEPLLHLALGLLIAGNGFFKPNISTMVGGLYGARDARRDGAFTIFYMGINLGAFLAPLVCGKLGERIGWHYGFSAAALGMGAGVLVFAWGQRLLARVGLPPARSALTAAHDRRGDRLVGKDYIEAAAWVVAVSALVWATLQGLGSIWSHIPAAMKLASGLLIMGIMLVFLFRENSKKENQQLVVLVVLCAFNIFFWLGFEQAGGTMTLFADQQTDRTLGWAGFLIVCAVGVAGGFSVWLNNRQDKAGRLLWITLSLALGLGIPAYLCTAWLPHLWAGRLIPIVASEFQAINPLLIVVMAPTFSKLWLRLDNSRFRTATPTKMAIGLGFLGAGFVVLYGGQTIAEEAGQVGPGWLAAVYFFHTTGELCLSPIGLSMTTKLAPARVGSLAMGVWFASSFAANLLAGQAESIVHAWHLPLYGVLIATSFGSGLLLLALTPWLKRWMHGQG